MEGNVEFTQPIETVNKNNPEVRFKKLAENTGGTISAIEDPNVKESIPFIINYRIGEPTPAGTIRVYRGVRNVSAVEATQFPSLLKTDYVDQELTDLTIELGNNPSPEIYNKLRAKNDQLGNSNRLIDKAEKYINETMRENNCDYSEAFKFMHRYENTASPYVSASGSFDNAFSYSIRDGRPGMVIVADIPEALITHDFFNNLDKEVSIKGPIEQKYVKSIFLTEKRHSSEDKSFIESAQKSIK
jgi:hypothetical protein